MHPPHKSKAERDLAAACGGRHTTVQRHDGREERVFVRQLPLRFGERYIELCLAGNEQHRIELCIGQSWEWDKKYRGKTPADRFTVEAQVKLLELAEELNFPTALAQIERRKNTIGGLEPLLKRLYNAQTSAMKEAFNQLAISALSAARQLQPSAEATPNSGATGASTKSDSPSNNTTPSPASPPSATSTPPPTPSQPSGSEKTPTTT